MSSLQIHLFGKFCILSDERAPVGLDARKAQELLAYLLLYRSRPHSREALASVLWNDSARDQSLKALRQTLWQVQSALDAHIFDDDGTALQIESGWVQLNPRCKFWLDVAVLEQCFTDVQGVLGRALDEQSAQALDTAVQLYQGDLMEDCYLDWCLYERERLQNLYLIMLDKLMDYCEAHGDYEAGLAYGTQILRYDRACERAYRRLMRLYYRAGNRTAALRKYVQCVAALKEELDVAPGKHTMDLYNGIKADRPLVAVPPPADTATSAQATSLLFTTLTRLKNVQAILANLQGIVEEDIQAVETLVDRPASTRPGL